MRKRSFAGLTGGATTGGLALATAAGFTLLTPGLASAQLEEIVVTASRRGETDLQTTPVAISVIGEEDFSKLYAFDIGEISQFVPNFSAATVTGFNAASFAMRGAGETDIIVYFDPKVGVLIDDFVVPHVQTQLLEPFDIESLEVLRGPQGTLFGRNTTAGAVIIRTKRPDLDEAGLDMSLQYGSFNQSIARLSFDIPFAENWGFRFAGLYQQSDGYYKNGKVDNPVLAAGPVAGDGRDLGGKDVFSARAKLLWEPSTDFSLFGQIEYIRDSSDPTPVINDTLNRPDGQLAAAFGFPGVEGGDPLDQAGIHNSSIVGLDGDQRVDVDGIYLNAEWQVSDNHRLYANLGRRDQESRLPNEYLGTPFNSFFAATRDDDRETTQFEVRLASENDGPLNYVVGGFYQQNDAAFCVLQQLGLTEFFGTAVPGVLDNDNPLLLCNRQDAEAAAVFADFSYVVNDRLTVSVGGRYTDESKDYITREGTPTAILFPDGFNTPLDGQDFAGLPGRVETDSQSWEEPTWRFTASYDLTDDVFGYFTYTRGFKSGGYNDQAGSGGFDVFPVAAYDPEFANSYEIGIKSTFADDRVRLNATYFFVNYEDFQRSTVVSIPGTGLQETRTFNAAEVDASGIEAEMEWAVTESFMLRAHLGTIDAEYKEFLLDRDGDPATAPSDFSGRDVTRAPDFNAGIDATYTMNLTGGSTLRFNANYKHEAENTYYYADDLTPEFDTELEQRDLVNANIAWNSADGTWRLAAFGKNLTDDRYKTASQSVGILWTFSNYGPPRSYGVEVGYRFGAE
ncbi:MAG: TonB-dependent receptor [Pseudomonadota bacterium]